MIYLSDTRHETRSDSGSNCLDFKARDPKSFKIYGIPEMNVRLNDIGHGLDPIWISLFNIV